jgi:ABC-type multidrug transport system fused ATPase/permease subunit
MNWRSPSDLHQKGSTLPPESDNATEPGQVLLDGRDLRDYTVDSLRQNIALVLQETVLLTGSILDNIAFGNPDATEEQLHAAAEAAYVDEFVRHLPDGYDTTVGERGTTLSGGQRQRIAIARALVKDAAVG